nr:glycine oxidase ThiO [Microlunatus panaciterrae]
MPLTRIRAQVEPGEAQPGFESHQCSHLSSLVGRPRSVRRPTQYHDVVPQTPTADVVIVGGGLIGTSIGWRLAQAGLRVTVVAGDAEAAASRVAAGMLAPVTETTFTEEKLLRLTLASIGMFDDFATEVGTASGLPVGLRRTPTLSVASTADDAARLGMLADYLTRIGLESERLTSRECRRQEPLLAPTIRSGLLVGGDWSCDNRLLWAALREAAGRAGVRRVDGAVGRLELAGDRVVGVRLSDGSGIATDQVVVAAGAWAGQLDLPLHLPVRPVKGQILRLDPAGLPQPGLTVRAFSQGAEVYLVPRESGHEVVVGATVEDLGFDPRVTAGGVYELLRDARAVIPMTAEYTLAETSVGYRPGTPDNAPILGASGIDGVTLATGHYRNGVLLTPITASVVAAAVLDGALPDVAAGFTLARFEERER